MTPDIPPDLAAAASRLPFADLMAAAALATGLFPDEPYLTAAVPCRCRCKCREEDRCATAP